MEELKKCPFCGGEARINAYGFNQYSVECLNCGAETSREQGVENAIQAWNKRVE